MIIHADRQPHGRRLPAALASSLLIHVMVATAVLWVASVRPPAEPVGAGGGSGRYTPRHSSALVRAGQFGAEPTGTADARRLPIEATAWPVRQAERLRLRLVIGSAIDHLWQSTLFAVVVGLLALAFRRNRARVRYALWFVASVKFLVPFSLVIWFGSVVGSTVLALPGVAAELGSAGSPRAFTGAVWTLLQDLVRHPLIGGIGQWLKATGSVALWPSSVTLTEITAAWLALALIGAWACGFVALVVSRIRLSRKVWDIALVSRRVELIDVKVPARLQVGLADGTLEPGVIGWLHPVLLLPADIERHLTRPEIEAIVAHELCHVRRFDNLTAAIHMLVEAIFWFHPLVWWLGARLVDERERACDEHVLRSVGAPGPYAKGILNVCKQYVGAPIASVSGVSSANVRQRIDAILANRIGEATGPWKKMVLSGASLCLVVVPMAAGALQPPRHATPSHGTSSGGLPVVAGYALVVASVDQQLGPALTRVRSADSDAAQARPPVTAPGAPVVRPGEISADAIALPQLAALLARTLGRDVEDRSGLTGTFTVRLTWASEPGGPSLFTAVQQQLGLRLVPLTSENQVDRRESTNNK